MSYVKNISDVSYDHTGTKYDGRFNDLFVDGHLISNSNYLYLPWVSVGITTETTYPSGNPRSFGYVGTSNNTSAISPVDQPLLSYTESLTITAPLIIDRLSLRKMSFVIKNSAITVPAGETLNIHLGLFTTIPGDYNLFFSLHSVVVQSIVGPASIPANTNFFITQSFPSETHIIEPDTRIAVNVWISRINPISSATVNLRVAGGTNWDYI